MDCNNNIISHEPIIHIRISKKNRNDVNIFVSRMVKKSHFCETFKNT